MSLTNRTGATASFLVGASSTLPIGYRWLKDGNFLSDGGPVSGATEAELVLNPISRPDAGVYTVVITNAFGSVTSSPANLFVVESFFTRVEHLTNGAIQLSLSCDSNLTWRAQASTNLADWEPLTDIHDTNGVVRFIDMTMTNLPRRFYRAVWLP